MLQACSQIVIFPNNTGSSLQEPEDLFKTMLKLDAHLQADYDYGHRIALSLSHFFQQYQHFRLHLDIVSYTALIDSASKYLSLADQGILSVSELYI